MKIKSAIIATLCLVASLGCTRVHHSYQPFVAAGTALPVEVAVKFKSGQPVSGTVHHRVSGQGAYHATPMQVRAGQLWAVLPTGHLQPQDTVEYYIDVTRDGSMHALGSPASPYVVTMLDRTELILSRLSDRPIASDEDHPVRIVLVASGQPVEQPRATYQIPGIPGEIRAEMDNDGRGNFHIIIPPAVVRAGQWKYSIEVPLEGETYRLPQQGYRTFHVKPVKRETKRMVTEIIEEHLPH
ncbi:MAG: hypothetical protein ACYTGG_09000 [Planctomycetota bacterium]|jgi:hypothetical protein